MGRMNWPDLGERMEVVVWFEVGQAVGGSRGLGARVGVVVVWVVLGFVVGGEGRGGDKGGG